MTVLTCCQRSKVISQSGRWKSRSIERIRSPPDGVDHHRLVPAIPPHLRAMSEGGIENLALSIRPEPRQRELLRLDSLLRHVRVFGVQPHGDLRFGGVKIAELIC